MVCPVKPLFRPLPLLLSPLFAVFSLNAQAAENWPEFRGPDRMGHSGAANVPVEWGPTQNIAWKTALPGVGWSSPILVDGKLYVTTAVAEKADDPDSGHSLRALCVDAASGDILWDVEVFHQTSKDATKVHKKNSHASPTPLYEDGKVYVHFGHDGTACLDAKDGKILWTQDRLRYTPVHGNGGSPALAGDKLIFSCDGAEKPFVVALDKKTGKVAWKTDRDVEVARTFSFSTPLAIEVNGKTQVIAPGSGAVIAYDPDNGKEIWRCGYGEGYSVVPRPVYAEGLIYVCTGFNQAKLMAIRPDGKGDVTDSHVAWVHDKAVPKESSVIVVDGLVYFNDDKGVASCLDAKTGEVMWQERIAAGSYSASPIYADGRIYFQNGEGVATVIEPGKELKKIAENDIGEFGLSSYAVTDGAIFIRTESALFRIGS